jgi:hypothetical protein
MPALGNHRRELSHSYWCRVSLKSTPMKKPVTNDMAATPVLSQNIQRFRLD